MIAEDGEKLNLGEVFGCWETAHGLLRPHVFDQRLLSISATETWYHKMNERDVCGEIDGLWSERKTKMLPGKNWFWEIRYTPLCAQQAIYWLNCHVRIEEIPCTTSILWCYDYMAIMTPLFKKLLCVTRVALCKQNITIQMNPLHRQVQQFISISKLIYKEGGFAAYIATNSIATAILFD